MAESPRKGQGATSAVQIPIMNNSDITQENEIFDKAQDLHGVAVLVVDDDADTLDLISFILEASGASVTAVSSATEALKVLSNSTVNVLISDIGMPEIDGYMLMERLKSSLDKPIPKAIALTAYAGEFNQQLALKAGFQKHLPKPIEPDELVTIVAQLIGR